MVLCISLCPLSQPPLPPDCASSDGGWGPLLESHCSVLSTSSRASGGDIQRPEGGRFKMLIPAKVGGQRGRPG